MKVLWLCNIMLPAIAEKLGQPYSNREGWLTGIYERICRERYAYGGNVEPGMEGSAGINTGEKIQLGICFPCGEEMVENSLLIEESGVRCYSFRENLAKPEEYDQTMEGRFQEIIRDFKPDMVHIFGTEFPHTLAMVKAFGKPERILIGIQGLCYASAGAYMANLPEKVVNRKTFRDRIKKDSILQQQEKFRIRGEHEKEALRHTRNITGRTKFDKTETEKINPDAKYFHMNETMRSPFYTGNWEGEKCIPHSIFLSQGDYPLKGFHYILQAMPRILESYPDAKIYVAGNSIINNKTMKDKIKISSYGKYLLELIKRAHLEEHVRMLGRLTAEEMKEQFIKSSLYLCPSALENSPNSLGEAMLLGVPAVAADTGGIPSLMEHEKEGLLYEAGNVEQLAAAVIRIWREPEETKKRAKAARKRAFVTHDGESNYQRLLEIYREICK